MTIANPTDTAAAGTSADQASSVFERRESVVRSYCRSWPVVFDRASGAEQTTEDGQTFLDFFSGAGALNYGHNHPVLKQALLDYLGTDRVIHSLDMFSVAKREFLEAFEEHILIPRGLDYRVQLPGPTGTNSVETALKIARKATGREQVVSFTNAFHGMTMGSLAVTGNSMKRKGAGIPLHHTTTAPYDDYLGGDTTDFLWLERVWSDSGSGVDLPAAVIVETVQGEGGLNAARAEWLRALADLCRRFEVLLVVDDVQAGCGRTGTFFSFEEAGIVPDVVCLSKSLSGLGLPFSVTLMRPELDLWEPGEHNGTFRGFNPAFVTATAALREFWSDDELAATVRERGDQLRRGLEAIGADTGGHYRGRGLLAGLHFDDPEVAERVAAEAFDRGLLVETSGPESEVVKVMPPLTISAADLDRGIGLLGDAVRAATPA
ncbi:diaminobutyrate-2-oxoglutarate transaminase [Barrientosiimonas humi]|uniref:Diaminobutyrate--2-oxoglutarate transaminase n=1 Tax=Barrientosiimonas humi TaxID=999931 RepID=A0A542XGM3_9MICO|nr:diaminobutyrate--2-oxoglutarate transaminase [Barrientosiimonas humi]TQL34955.1 diaminobutyrate-2-oxoglutarate transaminase [Barrientosiimonas humi]CAG7571142.1 Diaminobutyrate--2-oxoglutarate transaminase [Barrientosiimonas humi]